MWDSINAFIFLSVLSFWSNLSESLLTGSDLNRWPLSLVHSGHPRMLHRHPGPSCASLRLKLLISGSCAFLFLGQFFLVSFYGGDKVKTQLHLLVLEGLPWSMGWQWLTMGMGHWPQLFWKVPLPLVLFCWWNFMITCGCKGCRQTQPALRSRFLMTSPHHFRCTGNPHFKQCLTFFQSSLLEPIFFFPAVSLTLLIQKLEKVQSVSLYIGTILT